ncbi:glutathione S-transferase [Delitschia confertaspora ATCC 74209]|uniref:glutathione transferase n=1 Tax=Delitschia confertaspora ATCC 74209 TaxID=1513339 RepID=A0A9P4JBA9_9PLEO|nr:glutathione S-transferase [Delitschia confertaspora ATCC 74209]
MVHLSLPQTPLKLHGSAQSTSRVLLTILELSLPYVLVTVDIAKGEHESDEYRRLQPFGKVPVLEDGGLVVFESRAVCRYLCRKYGTEKNLMPSGEDIEAYAKFEQACSVEQSYFAAAAETIGFELFIKPKKSLGPPDLSRVAQAEKGLDTCLAIYDKILAQQKYIAGDELTLADLFHLPNGAALRAGKWRSIFERYGNVERWFKGLQERETWAKASGEAGTVT